MNDKNLFILLMRKDLTNYIINIPHHNMIFVAGDFNARLGLDRHQISPNIIGKNIYYKKSNENGEKLASFFLRVIFFETCTNAISTSKQKIMDLAKPIRE